MGTILRASRNKMIGGGEISVLAAAPALGYAVDCWADSWASRLGEPASESRKLPLLATIGLAVAIAAVAVAARDGLFAVLGAGLGWSLLALALVDCRYRLLPDVVTLPLIAAGLIAAALAEGGLPVPELVGAAAGFASLAGLRWLHARWRGREGLGLGDAKLLAAAGAWLGWEPLPLVILLASLTALLVALPGALRSGRGWQAELPFGPYLAAAIWGLWLYGPEGIF